MGLWLRVKEAVGEGWRAVEEGWRVAGEGWRVAGEGWRAVVEGSTPLLADFDVGMREEGRVTGRISPAWHNVINRIACVGVWVCGGS